MSEKLEGAQPGGHEPTIKTEDGELQPYREQNELMGKRHLDSIIVFGNGPVKPLLLPEQLTPEQKTKWEEFKQAPLQSTEPDFRVLEEDQSSISEGSIAERRDRWQRVGRFGLNRWGRQGALAAGLVLYLGTTDKLILSGGRTMPAWAKSVLTDEQQADWPSEAELMKDIIVRRYGELYLKKYGEPIEDHIIIEDKSNETLENFAYTINSRPEIVTTEKVGILGADYHVRRIAALAHIFSIWESPRSQFSAQELLRERAQVRNKQQYEDMQQYLRNALENPDLRRRLEGEERWERGVVDESYLGYWLGSLSDIEDPALIQKVLVALRDPLWRAQAITEFQKAGLDFDRFSQEDLTKLSEEDSDRYNGLIEGLRKLKADENRSFPPAHRPI